MNDTEFKNTLSVAFYNWMAKAKISQNELANKTGIAQGTISRINRKEGIPNLFNIVTLAKALGVGPEEFARTIFGTKPSEDHIDDNKELTPGRLKARLPELEGKINFQEAIELSKAILDMAEEKKVTKKGIMAAVGTNYFIVTQNKITLRDWFSDGEYEITDEPFFGYKIHIAKTSAGWLPLFQAHRKINSLVDLQHCCEEDGVMIVDEYGRAFDWEDFEERVVRHNGGVKGGMVTSPVVARTDKDMPLHSPVSHTEYTGYGKNDIFVDKDGYEFSMMEFR